MQPCLFPAGKKADLFALLDVFCSFDFVAGDLSIPDLCILLHFAHMR